MEELEKLQKIMKENGWTLLFLRKMVRALDGLQDVETAVPKE